MANTQKSLTPDDARAEYAPFIGRNTFYEMLRKGVIPSIRLNHKFLIPRVAMEKWLETCGASTAEKASAAGSR